MLPVHRFDERFIVMATRQGTIKRTPLRNFSRPMKGGIRAISLEENDTLIGVELTSGKDEVMLATADGMAIRFAESEVRSMGRAAQGVTGIRLREGDYVTDLIVANPSATLLTVCENGYGKRTVFDEYRVQGRAGLGIINIRTSERNGRVVGMMAVEETDDLMIVSQGGMIVRVPVASISTIGRNTQGVRVIRLRESDRVVSVARVPHEEPDVPGEPGPPGDAPPADASSAEPDEDADGSPPASPGENPSGR
jgi:DNA gyrase subunit A